MDDNLDLLNFQVEVHRCVTKTVPLATMTRIFLSNTRQEGRLECLIQHLGFIDSLEDEHQAYELALALLEAGVAFKSNLLVSRAAETYLQRDDADLRVLQHFERLSPYLRSLEGQFLLRQTVLEAHSVKVASLLPECDKMIDFLATTRDLCKVSPRNMVLMQRSPSWSSFSSISASITTSAVSASVSSSSSSSSSTSSSSSAPANKEAQPLSVSAKTPRKSANNGNRRRKNRYRDGTQSE